MKEKIVDVIPKREDLKKEDLGERPKEPKEKEISKKSSYLKKFSFNFWLLLFVFILFLGSVYFSRATIKIFPLIEEKKLKGESVFPKEIEVRMFTIQKTIVESFPTRGTKEKAAQGIIRLYNNFTTKDEVWRAGTRFISQDGKIFLSKDKILVPGAKIVNGKMVPSTVDVEVLSAEKGEAGNIGPSKFSVLAYKGTPRYEKYYGESLEPMKGGGKVKVVTKEDIEEAEKSISKNIEGKISQIIKKEIPTNYVFNSDSVKFEILEKTPKNKEGDETENLNFEVKIKIQVLAPNKEKLENLIFAFLENNIGENQSFLKDKLSFNFKLEEVNWEKGEGKIVFEIDCATFPKLNLEKIKREIKGKSIKSAIESVLKENPKILKAKTSLTPFWLPVLPFQEKRIEIIYPSL
jgi:hypothetical protein